MNPNNCMTSLVFQRPYPIEALPPIMFNAIRDAQQITKASSSLIASSMLGASFLACQSKIDVRRMEGLISPCSLFVLSIAESGDRKSTCDKLFMQPIRDFEESQAVTMKPILAKYRAEKSASDEKKKGLLRAIRTQAKQGEPTDELTQSLEELESNEPIEPKVPKLIFTNATPQAIVYCLYKRWKFAGIMSDEGAVIFDSRAMNELGMLNQLWDGNSLHVDRVSKESFSVTDARLTISIMVQPKTFDKFLEKQGRLSRDNGFLARFLVSRTVSTQGTRFIQDTCRSDQHLKVFQNRMTEILNSTVSDTSQNVSDRVTLSFSPDAQLKWVDFFNRVEFDLQSGGYLADVKDGASKIADNLARIAALFHYFQGGQGEISLDTVNRAAAICEWHLHEFKSIFGTGPEIPIEIQDANELEKWFVGMCHRYPGNSEMNKNYIAQLGPNQLRKSKLRREAALYVLTANNKICVALRGKTRCVVLNPAFFPIHGGQQAAASAQQYRSF